MIKHKCEYLRDNGICCGNLDVCCVYQNHEKYSPLDDEYKNIHSIKETFCDYPNETPNKTYADAIKAIANLGVFRHGQIR